MPLIIAAASFIGGRFLESAGPMINVLLLAGSSALFAEALAAALVRHGHLPMETPPVVLIAGAALITILLNPGLDGAVVLSSYADCGTGRGRCTPLLGVEMARCPREAPQMSKDWRLRWLCRSNAGQFSRLAFSWHWCGGTDARSIARSGDPNQSALLQPSHAGSGIVLLALWLVCRENLSNSEQA
jgi:hypothetical protein